MKGFSATVLLACVAVAAAQIGVTPGPSVPSAGGASGPLDIAQALSGSLPNTGGASLLGSFPTGGGPLTDATNPATTSTSTTTSTTKNNAAGSNNPISQIFRNPLMSYGLMGGDNARRAFMMPFLSRLGGSNAANYYYLRGGMDKFASVMMSDMINSMLSRSTGMHPLVSSMFASQIADAPDNYVLSNMLLNRGGLFGGNGSGSSSSSGQGTGTLPTGAASPFQAGANGMFSGFSPAALASMTMI